MPPEHPAQLTPSAGTIPAEVLQFLRGKSLTPSFDYREVWGEEHAFAFTVAKTTQMDVLSTLYQAVDDAVEQGLPYQQFAKKLEPKLRSLGWWGQREVVDPQTGELVNAQLGSPRRLRTIFEANIRSAHAAGQWARIQETRDIYPYLLYRLGPSREHRAEHQHWAGTLLPVNDPFWITHATPNGYGCKCRIEQVSVRRAEQLRALGSVSTQAPAVTWTEWVNKRTGAVERVPQGIDPGWGHNPGLKRADLIRQRYADSAAQLHQLQRDPRTAQWFNGQFELDADDDLNTTFAQELARLAGAPDGGTVTVSNALSAGWGEDNQLSVEITHPFLEAAVRVIDQEAKLVHNLFLDKSKHAPDGFITALFVQQVKFARASGFRIEATAGGQPNTVLSGYYRWPRIGYDGPLDNDERAKLPIQLRSATTIQELFALPGGRTWWKRNGWQKELVFDPTPGSASMRTLNRYLLEQGIRP